MAQGPSGGYEVTGVTQETKFAVNGTPVPGKNVAFTTTTGYQGTLFIPDSVFGDTNALRLAIEGEVRSIVAAMAIKGNIGG